MQEQGLLRQEASRPFQPFRPFFSIVVGPDPRALGGWVASPGDLHGDILAFPRRQHENRRGSSSGHVTFGRRTPAWGHSHAWHVQPSMTGYTSALHLQGVYPQEGQS